MLTLFTQDMASSRSALTSLMPVLRFVHITYKFPLYNVIPAIEICPLGTKFSQDCLAFDFIKSLLLASG
jgi:hypothetical protein